ncbi:hypothetical protein T484DRAFT_1843061 [Baffinella frigidus]|nr:hypothetical protein T484DRAFT_1843061 [Cryptophyta sp. CCMP2293]
MRLRARVSEVEGKNTKIKDELYRTRGHLDSDRETALQYAQEIQNMQQKYGRQINELQASDCACLFQVDTP